MNYPYYTKWDGENTTIVKIEDAELLKAIALHPNITQYVRIHILNMNEEEDRLIQGRVTGGNISLNASSPVRRSGSLSLVADQDNCDITSIDNIISINKRAKIEIGIETELTPSDAIDDKIWFNLGVFVLTNANLNKSLSGFTMSVNLKDKMALLNGECGGTIYSMITHSPVLTVDGKEERVPFAQLITELVEHWGKIPRDKIIINDIAKYNNNTYTWNGSVPLYVRTTVVNEKTIPLNVTLDTLSGTDVDVFTKGQAVCYTLEQQVYPTELTSAVGESVASVLDKIKKTLGNYEYFFDIDGNFIFQQIPNGLNEGSAFDNLTEAFNDAYFSEPTQKKAVFSFEDDTLLVSCSNQPKYEAIKNDYVVWGAKGTSKTPIRYHLAIDIKPKAEIVKEDGSIETRFPAEYNVQCYQDDFGYWRAVPKNQTYNKATPQKIIINDWRAWLYYDYVVNDNYNDYGQELEVEFPKQYNLRTGLYCFQKQEGPSVIELTTTLYDLVYWLDFLDPDELTNTNVKTAIREMTVDKIGRRTKTLKDETVNCIFNIRPLDILLLSTEAPDISAMREEAINKEKAYYQIGPDISRKMSSGNWNCSAYDTIRAVIHETTAYNNTISLTTIPVFHLEPGIRIEATVKEESKSIIDGEYMINTINVPLAYNGNMTISASRAIERI